MPKRNRSARRTKSGRAIPDRAPSAIDRGTPEIQAMRLATLGSAATLLPLSHADPVDVLTARGFLSREQNQAARDFQRVHRIVYGPSSAQAISLDPRRGGEMPTRARLVAERQLDAWTGIVRRAGRFAADAFSRYVINGYSDLAILEIGRGTGDIDAEAQCKIINVRSVLEAIATYPRIRVTDQDIAIAELAELIGSVDRRAA